MYIYIRMYIYIGIHISIHACIYIYMYIYMHMRKYGPPEGTYMCVGPSPPAAGLWWRLAGMGSRPDSWRKNLGLSGSNCESLGCLWVLPLKSKEILGVPATGEVWWPYRERGCSSLSSLVA